MSITGRLLALEHRVLFDGAGAEPVAPEIGGLALPESGSDPAPEAETREQQALDEGKEVLAAPEGDDRESLILICDDLPGGDALAQAMRIDPDRPLAEQLDEAGVDPADYGSIMVINRLEETSMVETARYTDAEVFRAEVEAGARLGDLERMESGFGDPSRQVLFVDEQVSFAGELIAAIGEGWEVLRISAGSDGLDQMLDALEGRDDLTAVHIFSHGAEGEIRLGDLVLDADAMEARAGDLARLGEFLTDDGDLLIYGCDVAAGFIGEDYVSRLAELTGADIAASDDATGAGGLGGDWELEVAAGPVEAGTIEASGYANILATDTFSSDINSPRLHQQASGLTDGYFTPGDDAENFWADSFTTDRVVEKTVAYTDWKEWFQHSRQESWSYGRGVRYASHTITVADEREISINVSALSATVLRPGGAPLVLSGAEAAALRPNYALYRGSFDPAKPFENLVVADQTTGDGGALFRGRLEPDDYILIASFDGMITGDGNDYFPEQIFGSFQAETILQESAPVWTSRDIDLVMTGGGEVSVSIPLREGGDVLITDPESGRLDFSAEVLTGGVPGPLPGWLHFNPNSLTFTGDPAPGTAPLSIRLTASDGDNDVTKDITLSFTDVDNAPFVKAVPPEQIWSGAGVKSFDASVIFDDGEGNVPVGFTATLANGNPLPSWLTINASTGVLSGNPPAGAGDLTVRITADDGSGSSRSEVSGDVVLRIHGSNDRPVGSDVTISLAEGETYDFMLSDFGFLDNDTHASNDTASGIGNRLEAIRIETLPDHGVIWLDVNGDGSQSGGEAVRVNQVIARADIAKLHYRTDRAWAGGPGLLTPADNFTWSVGDGAGFSESPSTTTLNVSLVNNPATLIFSGGAARTFRFDPASPISPTLVDAGLRIIDPDAKHSSDPQFSRVIGARIQVLSYSSGEFIEGDVLSLPTVAGFTTAYNSETGVMSVTGVGTAAEYQALLRGLEFSTIGGSGDDRREVAIILDTEEAGEVKSVSLDGSDDHIDMMETIVPETGSFTVSVWARLDADVVDVPGNYTVLSSGLSAEGIMIRYEVKANGDKALNFGNGFTVTDFTGFDDGRWHQIVLERDSLRPEAEGGNAYFDGVLIGTGEIRETISQEGNFRIGRTFDNFADDSRDLTGYWKGDISDIRVFGEALTNDETRALLDRNTPPDLDDPQLLAWIPLAEDVYNHASLDTSSPLVFIAENTAWSQETGHYYRMRQYGETEADAIANAGLAGGEAGYLLRLDGTETAAETAIADRLISLFGLAGARIGLEVDETGDWDWSGGTDAEADLVESDFPATPIQEIFETEMADGSVGRLVAFDSFTSGAENFAIRPREGTDYTPAGTVNNALLLDNSVIRSLKFYDIGGKATRMHFDITRYEEWSGKILYLGFRYKTSPGGQITLPIRFYEAPAQPDADPDSVPWETRTREGKTLTWRMITLTEATATSQSFRFEFNLPAGFSDLDGMTELMFFPALGEDDNVNRATVDNIALYHSVNDLESVGAGYPPGYIERFEGDDYTGWSRLEINGSSQTQTWPTSPDPVGSFETVDGSMAMRFAGAADGDDEAQQKSQPSKTFIINNEESVLEFDFHALDGWDRGQDNFVLFLNDQALIEESFGSSGGTYQEVSAPLTGNATIDGKTVTWTITPDAAGASNYFGSSALDQKFHVRVELPAELNETVNVRLGMTGNGEVIANESGAVDNLLIYSTATRGLLKEDGSIIATGATALHPSLIEYGSSASLPVAPDIFRTETVDLTKRMLVDSRPVQIQVSNTIPELDTFPIVRVVPEDQEYELRIADFNTIYSDAEEDPLAAIRIVTLPDPVTGEMLLHGGAVTVGQIIPRGDINYLNFRPAQDFNGQASFSFEASDGFTSGGNYVFSDEVGDVYFNVIPGNDRPVADSGLAPDLGQIVEDITPGANAGFTIASMIPDGAITDVDEATAPKAILLDEVENNSGFWEYSIGGGAWTAVSALRGTVELGAAALLLAPTDRLRFRPDENYNGTARIGFRAWDMTEGTAGGTLDPYKEGGTTAVSESRHYATLTITPVNDAPELADATIAVKDGRDRVLLPADLAFTDAEGDALDAIRINSLPDAGALIYNNGGADQAVVAGQVISAADFSAGYLRYVPGTGDTSFTISASDGTVFSAPATVTIDGNEATTGILWNGATGAVDEDAGSGTAVGQLEGVDPDTGEPLRYELLSNSNFSVSIDGVVTVSDNAELDFEARPTEVIRVKVTDSAGLTYEQDLNVTIADIGEVKPGLISNPVTTGRDQVTVITSNDLKAVAGTGGTGDLVYTVTSASTEGGTFFVDFDGDGIIDSGEVLGPSTAEQPDRMNTFTQADIDAGRVKLARDEVPGNPSLSFTLSDGNESIDGVLATVTETAPVLASQTPNQRWSTTDPLVFQLPPGTFLDPDGDPLTYTATKGDGSPLPSWLEFDPETQTFSGTPVGVNDGDVFQIRVTASDGTASVTDSFVMRFEDNPTAPYVAVQPGEQTFGGPGVQSITLDPDVIFTERGGSSITSVEATLANGDPLPPWLSYNSTTGLLTGNPPADDGPGPLVIKINATAASGEDSEVLVPLHILNANDKPTAAGTLPDQAVTGPEPESFSVSRDDFTDADGDEVTLRPKLANGDPLPGWVSWSFDPVTGVLQFEANAPEGSGNLDIIVEADDGHGGQVESGFSLTWSGGVNNAPEVLTSSGIGYLNDAGILTYDPIKSATRFTIQRGQTAIITSEYLQELDPDDDGTGVTFTLTGLPTRGELFLDADGDGIRNPGEAALTNGATFTQADIDAGRLGYRHTAGNAVDDSFILSVADGGENGAQALAGVEFDIKVLSITAAPSLLAVIRGEPADRYASADQVSFDVVFSERLNGIGIEDFIATGTAASGTSILSVVNTGEGRYRVTVGGAGLANANGTLGLELSPDAAAAPLATPGASQGFDSTTPRNFDQSYLIRNNPPTVTLESSTPLHDGVTPFTLTLEFNEVVAGLELDEITVSNATLSNLGPERTGESFTVTVTPTGNGAITLTLGADLAQSLAKLGNLASSPLVIDYDAAPVFLLDPDGGEANRAISFTENGTAPFFTSDGVTFSDANAGQGLEALRLSLDPAQFVNGADERLLIEGADAGGVILYDYASDQALPDVVLGGVTYKLNYIAAADGDPAVLTFTASDGGALSLGEAEALLDAMRYQNNSEDVKGAPRVITLTADAGVRKVDSVLTITANGVNDAPVIAVEAGDSDEADLTETNGALAATGALSVSDPDLADEVTASVQSVTTSGVTTGLGSANAALQAMLSLSPVPVIDGSATSGKLNWSFASGAESFDYLKAGEELVLTYSIQVTDGTATADRDVTITITGTNDAPLISLDTGDSAAAALTETDAALTTSGTLSVSDIDLADEVTASVVSVGATGTTVGLGSGNAALQTMLSLSPATVMDGSADSGELTWNFNSGAEIFNYLKAGEELVLTWLVRVTDGTATADRNVTITITGANDAPVITVGAGDSDTAVLSEANAALTTSGSLTVDDPDRSDLVNASVQSVVASGVTGGLGSGNAALKAMLSLSANPVINGSATSGQLDWNFSSGSEAFNYLDAGEQLELTYTLQVTDGTVTADKTVTITITGANDAPVITVASGDRDTANLTETDAALITSGTLSVEDPDLTDEVTATVQALAVNGVTGGLGSTNGALQAMLSLSPTPVFDGTTTNGKLTWSFNSGGESFDYLGAGENLALTYQVRVTDGTLTTDRNVTITITGSNDDPVISIEAGDSADAALTETNGELTATGTLSVDDFDRTNIVTASVDAVAVFNGSPGLDANTGELSAMLSLSPVPVIDSTGTSGRLTWSFASGSEAFDYLSAGEQLSLIYKIRMTDGTSIAERNVVITITGTNDAPEIAIGAGDSSTADLTETDTALSATGRLSILDVDYANEVTATVQSVAASGVTTGLGSGNPELQAMLSLSPATVIGDSETAGKLDWSFDSGSEMFNYLEAGEELVLTYSIQVSDGTVTADRDVTITVTGRNDAPVISVDAGDSAAADLTETDAALASSGTLSVTDMDLADEVTASVESVAASGTTAGLGSVNAALKAMMTLSPETVIDGSGTSGELTWSFNSGSEFFDYLKAGQELLLTYRLRVTDGSATADRNVTITITGTNDAPVIAVGAGDSDTAALTETNAALTASGSLTVGDPDRSDVVNASVQSVVASGVTTGLGSGTAALEAMLNLSANPVINGSATSSKLDWNFASAPEAFNYLNAGEQLTLTYMIRVTDGSVTADKTVTITITGTNDTPVISLETGDRMSAALTEADAALVTSGTLSVEDLDLTDQVTATVQSMIAVGVTNGLGSGNSALQAMLSLSPTPVIDGTGTSGKLTWSFNSGSETFNHLKAGEKLVLFYTIRASDGSATADRNVTITITGANDAPVISIGAGDSVALALTETDDELVGTGTLSVEDLDRTDVVTASVRTVVASGVTSGLDSDNAALQAMLNLSPEPIIDGTATSGKLTWSFASGFEAFDYLGAGEELVLTYSIRVTDGTGTADRDVTITITGTNDAPEIIPGGGDSDEADLTETNGALAASGRLSILDFDLGDEVTATVQSVTASGVTTGLGSANAGLQAMLSLSPVPVIDGSATSGKLNWSFASGSESFDYLKAGEELVLTYSLQVTDGTATSDGIVTITVTGTNDAPVISLGAGDSAAADLTETDAALVSSGTLSVSDLDLADEITASVESVTASGITSGLGSGNMALRAMLSLSPAPVIDGSATGGELTWSFNSGSEFFNYLKAGEQLTLTYRLRVTDGTATADRNVTVTITGTNDAPVIAVGAGDSDTAALTETNAALTASGSLTVDDPDRSDVVNASVQSVVASGVTTGLGSGTAALEVMLNLSANPVINGSATSSKLDWNFASAPETFNYLNAGEQLTLTYTIRVTDGSVTADKTVTITITGTNDTPVISLETGDRMSAALTEADAALVTSGTLSVEDLDLTDQVTATVQSMIAVGVTNGLGSGNSALQAMLSLSPTPVIDGTGTSGKLTWSFNSGSETFNHLKAGEKLVLFYTIRASDGSATADRNVTITITGANDAPVISIGAGDSASADLTELEAVTGASGSFTVGDADAADVVSATVEYLTMTGDTDGLDLGAQAMLAKLSIEPNPLISAGDVTGVLQWQFAAGAEDFIYLADGETLRLSYELRITDGTVDVTDAVEITIRGLSGAPVIEVRGGDHDTAERSETDADIQAAGTLTVTDADLSDEVTASVTGVTSGGGAPYPDAFLLDMFRLGDNPVVTAGVSSEVLDWSFDSSGESFDGLSVGEVITFTYEIEVSDGVLTDQHEVTITITGTNDSPAILYAQTDIVDNVVEDDVTISSFALGKIAYADADLTDELVATHGDAVLSSPDFIPSQTTAEMINEAFLLASGDDGGPDTTLVWTFEIDPRDVLSVDGEGLVLGERLLVEFPVTVVDGNGGVMNTRVSLALTATVDGIVLSVAGEFGEIFEGDNSRRTDAGSFSVVQQGATVTGLTVDPPRFALNSDDGVLTIPPAFSATITDGFSAVAADGSGSVDWTFSLAETDMDYLAENDLIAVFFDVTVSLSGGGSEIRTVSILISGSNDVPLVESDVSATRGILVEKGATEGTDTAEGELRAGDADRGEPPKWSFPAATTPGELRGTYGSITLAENGAWRYLLNDQLPVTDALKPGDVMHERFMARATDINGTFVEKEIVLTINGTNDLPLIGAFTSPSYVDTAGVDAFPESNGRFTASDVDADDVVTWIIRDQQADPGRAGFDHSKAGDYGVLWLNSLTGDRVYVPDARAINLASGPVTDNFAIVAQDSHGGESAALFAVSITGVKEEPVISVETGDSAAGELTGSGGGSLTGQLSVNFIGNAGTVTAEVKAVKANGVTSGLGVDNAGLLAMMTPGSDQVLAPGEEAGELNWSFESGAEDFEYLGAGEVLTLTYTIGTSENTDPAGHDVTITIIGINDAPEPGPIRGAVLKEIGRPLAAEGQFAVTDADRSDRIDVRLADVTLRGKLPAGLPGHSGLLNMLGLEIERSRTGDASRADVAWQFNSGRQDFHDLKAGETLYLDYHLEIADQHGEPVSRMLTIEIRGKNSRPVITDEPEPTHVIDSAAPATENGIIHVKDADGGGELTASSTVAIAVQGGGAEPGDAERAMVEAGFGYELIPGSNGGVVKWHLDLPKQPFPSLPAGTVVRIRVDVTISDGEGGEATRTLEFSVTTTGSKESTSGQHAIPDNDHGYVDDSYGEPISGSDGPGVIHTEGIAIFGGLSGHPGMEIGLPWDLLPEAGEELDFITADLFVAQSLPPLTLQAGSEFDFEVPAGTFVSTAGQRQFKLSAQLSNGESLPEWLHFTPETGGFVGTAPKDADTLLEIVVRARDWYGNETSTTFTMEIFSSESADGSEGQLSEMLAPPAEVKKLLTTQLQEAMLSRL